MIKINWTEKLPTVAGYYLFQRIHRPDELIHTRVDQEVGPKLLYVVYDGEQGFIYKETEQG